ncbi:MAG TPA: hypothetical protein PK489_03205 [Prolixibacteraceae bacterium]|nr:hypothetical protein [Prolixibacteraceae bacterium]HPJ77779.1 hypothetical protein [Prolixibacteraceae bacterium]
MKTGRFALVLFLSLVLAGCFVASFYPLYTSADLHPDTLLAGEWFDGDSTLWKFDYITVQEKDKPSVTDSTGYILTFREKGEEQSKSSMEIRVVRLDGNCFLDFFINEIKDENYPDFFDLHTMAIHTFAMVTQKGDSLLLTWLGTEWIKEHARAHKLKVAFLERDDDILLTAPTSDLQKFMVKCATIPEAWEKGTSFLLHRPSR